MSRELGEFLRARRQEVSPASAGLPDDGRRRVPGLRREEVARLASISRDYYTRLEQGRRQAAEPVLEALARALRLSEDERVHLFALSGREATPRPAQPAPARSRLTDAGSVVRRPEGGRRRADQGVEKHP